MKTEQATFGTNEQSKNGDVPAFEVNSRRQYLIKCDGITPLVMNKKLSPVLEADKKKTADKIHWEREHIKDSLYLNGREKLIIPAMAIKKMVVVACSFYPGKPVGLGFKSFAPLFQAALIVEDDAELNVPVGKIVPWETTVNLDPSKGNKGPRGPRCRPMIPLPWHAETYCSVITDAITTDVLDTIAAIAGKLCGLLDARRVDMGRCEITVTEVKA